MDEIYYAPLEGAQRLSVQEVADRLAKAGLPCKIEPEGQDMFWLAFDGAESNIFASVKDGAFVFGTLNVGPGDPSHVGETVDEVLRSIGFSADEGADYD